MRDSRAAAPARKCRCPGPSTRRHVPGRVFRPLSGASHRLRSPRSPPRSADRQLPRRPEGLGGPRGRLAHGYKEDRSADDRRRPASRHLRHRPPGDRRRRRDACLPQRGLERQPDDRLAGERRLSRHHSARGLRRCPKGRIGSLGRAAEIHRHRNRESGRRPQAGLHGTQAERSDRHRPGSQPRVDAAQGFAVRLAVAAGQDAGIPEGLRRARRGHRQPGGHTLRGLPRERISAGRA